MKCEQCGSTAMVDMGCGSAGISGTLCTNGVYRLTWGSTSYYRCGDCGHSQMVEVHSERTLRMRLTKYAGFVWEPVEV